MKILAIHPYYDRDTATDAAALRRVLKHQAANGRSITVITTKRANGDTREPAQSKSDTVCDVTIQRIPILRERNGSRFVRAINTAWFLTRVLIHALSTKPYDLAIANNRPPLLMGCVLRTIHALRGTPYIYICDDIYPQSAAANGEFQGTRLQERLRHWEAATCSAARRVIVPSHDMAETLTARGVPVNRISVIKRAPFIAASHDDRTPKASPSDSTNPVRFLFVGNLEKHQGLDRLISAARLVAGRVPFQFVVAGEGSAKPDLVELAGDLVGRRIVFVNSQSPSVFLEAVQNCDYGIVSLAADAYRSTYPSESTWYAAAGRPVIAVIEPQSEFAQTIAQHDWGYIAASRSVTDIAETIVKAVSEHASWTSQRRMQLEQSSRTLFGEAAMQTAWSHVIDDDYRESVAMPRQERTSRAA